MIKTHTERDFLFTIGVYENALTPQECKDIIRDFEQAKDEWREGGTLGGVDHNIKNTHDISCHEHKLMEKYEPLFAERSNAHIDKYLDSWPHKDQWDAVLSLGHEGTYYPCWQIQKYDKGVGHYNGWHTEENYSYANAHRLYVVMFYLNDVAEGGQTEFLYPEVGFQPKAGTFLCWPAGFPWVHKGSVPISNDKYICTTWLQASWGPLPEREE